jgi:hypothetical protein
MIAQSFVKFKELVFRRTLLVMVKEHKIRLFIPGNMNKEREEASLPESKILSSPRKEESW